MHHQSFLLILMVVILISNIKSYVSISVPCAARNYGGDSIVCVCNSSYCDYLSEPEIPTSNTFHLYTSDRGGKRFHFSQGQFSEYLSERNNGSYVTINTDGVSLLRSYEFEGSSDNAERVQGFGGAFTDAAAINYISLSPKTRKHLINSYFDPDGIKFNLCRLSIAGSDFSTRLYSYDDWEGDDSLEHFNLTEEDYKYKIPMILEAQKASGFSLQIMASPWSSPAWMKENKSFMGRGSLLPMYFQTFADYMIKFLDAYKKNGIEIWALTTSNEPTNGLFGDYPKKFQFNCLGWSPVGMAKWIGENLGPSLRASGHKTKIYILDEQKFLLPWYIEIGVLLNGYKWLRDYVDGIAVHYYLDFSVNALDIMRQTRKRFPSQQIINTEASHGLFEEMSKVSLGVWARGEHYAENIIDNMQVGLAGWMEFNLALDLSGGPSWNMNPLDASILVNAEKDEFYKQPTFYVLGHFSKFIKRGSRVLKLEHVNSKVKVLATVDDCKKLTIVLLNKNEEDVPVTIHHSAKGYIHLKLSQRSISTLIYQL